jgi:type I restriction enzyme M protein
VINEDLVEVIIHLPKDLFYNTPIDTYVWIITKGKAMQRHNKIQLIDATNCFVKRWKSIGNKRVDLNDDCISLIIEAYESFDNGIYKHNGLIVESKVFENDYFGFTKVAVETALCDADGKPILKKGKLQALKGETDSEFIPLTEDVEDYMRNNVLPYNPAAFLDRSKDKIGYEIPFTRLFYKFVEPVASEVVFSEIKQLETAESALMEELFRK